ncbi:MAG: multicopper oxidase domain-containing protein [Methylococcales bacterium]|nr:multicopper oxidase domain-containing protein [Methylococcales bacterium]
MTIATSVQRRRFLSQSLVGLAAFTSFPSILSAMGGMQDFPKVIPNKASANFKADVEFDLFCRSGSVSILPGQKTQVQQYSAVLKTGPKHTLIEIPGSYLGPIINLQKGQKVRINLYNQLPEPTVTHWHGLHVPANMDGHPQYTISPGEVLVYEFEVLNRAGMNIYHPHPHEATAKQVYHGLAGALFVRDAEESALELPSGLYEIPIVIQDRRFDHQNQLIYASSRHDHMLGFYGDRIVVNGRPHYQLDVESRAYRLRVLNGSNARIYKLAWDDGTPLTVIGVDGGLLEQPEVKPYVMLAPGERLDVWADFSGRKEGSELVMKSLPFSGVLPKMAERMGGMMQSSLSVGSDYPIFTVRVAKSVSDSPKLPSKLSTIVKHSLSEVANPNNPLPIAISESPMAMLLNGKAYAFNDEQPSERIKVNTIQLIEIFHAHGAGGHGGGMGMGMMKQGGGMGMMMSMAHPIHLHGQQFQIVSRSISTQHSDAYASVRDGFIETGLKDTVLVMPGETVRIIKPFQDFKGLFMFHCHNLEHEDMGMMRDFLVE